MEEWRDIAKCPGYQVSNLGRVRSIARTSFDRNGRIMRFRDRVLKLHIHMVKGKPSSVRITIRRVCYLVHHLVLEAFVGKCPRGLEGCHNDGDALNNREGNLRWDTRQSNVDDVYRHGGRRRDWQGTPLRSLSWRPFVSGYLCGISGLI